MTILLVVTGLSLILVNDDLLAFAFAYYSSGYGMTVNRIELLGKAEKKEEVTA